MTSWFNNIANQIQDGIQEAVTSKDHVSDLISALTLSSPEIAAEQARINEEESRKECVKDALASLLPWETRNEEHEILVAECHDEILQLSMRENTFSEPFGKGNLEIEAKALADLEDYPSLLRRFDLDAHVGLVERLFQEDANLVQMHSQFARAGDKEYNFWKNYFYHCAVVRFKIGLSNSEIWDVPTVSSAVKVQSSIIPSIPFLSTNPLVDTRKAAVDTSGDDDKDDVSITFDSASVGSSSVLDEPVLQSQQPSTTESSSRSMSPEKDYEIITPSAGQEDVGSGDDELDDLEAEIARELES